MFNRHFFKMFLGLIGMILLGLITLVLVNFYEKDSAPVRIQETQL